MRGNGFRGLMAAAACALAAPGVAQGATVSVTGAPGDQVLSYTAAVGEANAVFVDANLPGEAVVRHDNAVPLTAGAGCAPVAGAATPTVSCPTQAGLDIAVDLGDLGDAVSANVAFPAAVNGGSGDDAISAAGFAGATAFSGGEGRDTIDYSGRAEPVGINPDGVANDGSLGETDAIGADFEVLRGGNANDFVVGTAGDDEVRGGFGVDVLIGLAGNDLLVGDGDCTDAMDAGAGDDVLRPGFGGCEPSVDVRGGTGHDRMEMPTNIAAGVAVILDDEPNDGFADYGFTENFRSDIEDVIGSNEDDLLVGGAADNLLDGGSGDDVVDGGLGADTLRGGAGDDAADYSLHTAPLSLTLDDGRNDGAAGEDDLIASTIEHLVGGSGDDELVGDGRRNALDGGPGADVLRGGEGIDTADYSLRTSHINVDLGSDAAGDGQFEERDDVRSDVEAVIGGQAGNALTGSTRDEFLIGGAERDTLRDPGGRDVLFGGERPDQIFARDAAVDEIACGTDEDTVQGDPDDKVESDCETVDRAAPAPQPPTGQVPRPGRTPPRVPRPRPSVTPVPDTRAPRAALFARADKLLTTMRRTSLSFIVGCDELCSSTATLTAHGATARSLARRGFKRGTVVARGSSAPNAAARVKLKPTARGRKTLRAFKRGRYRLTVAVTDAAGNKTTVRRTVTVLR